MTWDPVGQRVLLFGGGTTSTLFGDVWSFNGVTWTRVSTTGPARSEAGVAWDTRRGRLVVYGGNDGSIFTRSGETWEWDGTTWSLTSAIGPYRRFGVAMAYDEVRQVVVLFGGGDSTSVYGDTWVHDGRDWRRVATTGPSARASAMMQWDPTRGRVVLFGGASDVTNSPQVINDTWEWDGATWVQVPTASSPPARALAAMAFDEFRQRMVLTCGFTPTGFVSDTWELAP